MILLWTALAFLCGALPFSVWIGRYGLKKDITQYGDNNPGATNVLRAGGVSWYALALAFDISKGAVPAGLASVIFDVTGWQLVCICLMPPLGHAFSPFLKFRGGKALAAGGGVWIGLNPLLFIGVVLALIVGSLLVKPGGFAVMFAMSVLAIIMLTVASPASWFVVWLGQMALFVWTHRNDLGQTPRWFFSKTG